MKDTRLVKSAAAVAAAIVCAVVHREGVLDRRVHGVGAEGTVDRVETWRRGTDSRP